MRIEPEIGGVTLVLVGSFNPAILTPAWFALHGLLPEDAAENAELSLAHPEISSFRSDWLSLEATSDHLSVDSSQAPYVRLRDLVVRLIREHLPHTPLRAIGINRYVHFTVSSAQRRDRIGRALAPTAAWGDWERELSLDGKLCGLKSLTMTGAAHSDRPEDDAITATIEPSTRVGNRLTGVYVRVNDHYTAAEGRDSNSQLIGQVESCFDESIQRSDAIVDHIMSLGEK